MKNLTHIALGFILFFTIQPFEKLVAQNWGSFDNVLSQLDSAKRAEYLNNLNHLQIGQHSFYGLNGMIDSLNANLDGQNPISGNFGSLLPTVSLSQDSLLGLLNGSGYSSLDSLSALNQFDQISDVWSSHSDSLYGAFDTFNGQLTPVPDLPTYSVNPRDWFPNFDSLATNQQHIFDNTPANGPSGFQGVFDQLLNPAVFTSIELTGGTQHAKTNFYWQAEELTAPVIGLRTSEQFDRLWEPRWRMEASWFKNTTGVINNETITQQNANFNPFIINGSLDVMFNPSIGVNSAGAALRLITLLGIEAGTYAPAHREILAPFTTNNEGYTTGWGPVVGAGLSMKTGAMTVYALGTTAYGDVICNPDATVSNYRYRSNRLEAGVRYGNLISVRFEKCISSNWATDGNKHVRYNQITVGLPVTGLFH